MRALFYIICFVSFIQCNPAKQLPESVSDSSKDYTIAIESQIVEIDKLGLIYLVSSKNEFLRINQSYQITHRYFNNSLGAISSIDVSNPMRILAYQKDFGRITILDNTLAIMKDINLTDLGYTDVAAIAKSNDDNIWIYNSNTYRLLKINELGQTIIQSNSLLDLGYKDLNVLKIIEKDNYVYLLDSALGILIFDNLGQYIKTFPRKGITSFSARKNFISFLEDGKLLIYDTRFFEETVAELPFEIPPEGLLNVFNQNGKWYGIYKNGIIVN